MAEATQRYMYMYMLTAKVNLSALYCCLESDEYNLDMRVHAGVKRPQPTARLCHRGSPVERTARIRGCTDVDPQML